jgi:hypothetical protein
MTSSGIETATLRLVAYCLKNYVTRDPNHEVLTYLLTHSLMVLSPSRGAANCAATQEIPSILWKPKI